MTNQNGSPGTPPLAGPVRFEQLKAMGSLPSPKGAALAIIRLTQKESVSLAELAHAIKADPAFVGRLVKAANGVNMIGRRPTVSVQDALTVLGVPAVRSLALGFCLVSEYANGKCRNFDYGRFWSRSLVCAIALQALSQRTRAVPPEEAFSIGLLARIGELALATLFPDEYSAVLGQAQANPGCQLAELEQQAFVMTHAELTAAMLLDWGIPKMFTEPAFHHEKPDQSHFTQGSRQYALTYALALAEQIAEICLAPDGARRAAMPQLFMLGTKLSLDAETLTAICDRVTVDWQEWGALLNIKTQPVPPFEELSKASTSGPGDRRGDTCMRVLIVDDEASTRALLRALLTEMGHEVFEAVDGRQAFDRALEVQPQIMIVDWIMPVMDGIELTKSLRQTKQGAAIYILLLTAFEEDDRLIEAFECGVDDYMTKPLRPRVLTARLRAGQRLIQLQREIERDSEEIRRFAAELAVTNRRLQEAALTDALTGFPNRRYAMERFQQEWSAGTRSKRPLSCMVIDLDKFKLINDTYGHDVGDTALRQIAAALKSALRAQDVICRVGGDEFLVICPDTTLAAAVAAAERIRKSVDTVPVVADILRLKGSVSIGVATREESMSDIDALIKRADQGAYLAKQQGRNCVFAVQMQ
jgi:two-component system cell cycle response regulator